MNSTVPVTSPFLWFGQAHQSAPVASSLPIYLPIHADPAPGEKEIESRVAEATGVKPFFFYSQTGKILVLPPNLG
jgi:hypothetical protein